METIACIKTRRSIRSFQKRAIDKEVLDQVVAAAAYAPSWKNTQITRYVFVESEEGKKKLLENTPSFNHNAIEEAAVVVIVSVIKKRSGYERDGSYSSNKEDGWQMFDAGVASQTLCLAAHELGLGTVIQGILDYEKIQEVFQIPEEREVVALIPMGYPAEEPTAPKRKMIGELYTIC
ncbi:nitroreductase family protein [Anaerosporobacter faecicola]|uniref:nitroreductase family protein n=1 Tax=Anaerosporobacter faecicola TaxID=2718714 RepID=UPI00143B9DD9|nr:nitroreductase family protein [Anaerosporobacter faecicola]